MSLYTVIYVSNNAEISHLRGTVFGEIHYVVVFRTVIRGVPHQTYQPLTRTFRLKKNDFQFVIKLKPNAQPGSKMWPTRVELVEVGLES